MGRFIPDETNQTKRRGQNGSIDDTQDNNEKFSFGSNSEITKNDITMLQIKNKEHFKGNETSDVNDKEQSKDDNVSSNSSEKLKESRTAKNNVAEENHPKKVSLNDDIEKNMNPFLLLLSSYTSRGTDASKKESLTSTLKIPNFLLQVDTGTVTFIRSMPSLRSSWSRFMNHLMIEDEIKPRKEPKRSDRTDTIQKDQSNIMKIQTKSLSSMKSSSKDVQASIEKANNQSESAQIAEEPKIKEIFSRKAEEAKHRILQRSYQGASLHELIDGMSSYPHLDLTINELTPGRILRKGEKKRSKSFSSLMDSLKNKSLERIVFLEQELSRTVSVQTSKLSIELSAGKNLMDFPKQLETDEGRYSMKNERTSKLENSSLWSQNLFDPVFEPLMSKSSGTTLQAQPWSTAGSESTENRIRTEKLTLSRDQERYHLRRYKYDEDDQKSFKRPTEKKSIKSSSSGGKQKPTQLQSNQAQEDKSLKFSKTEESSLVEVELIGLKMEDDRSSGGELNPTDENEEPKTGKKKSQIPIIQTQSRESKMDNGNVDMAQPESSEEYERLSQRSQSKRVSFEEDESTKQPKTTFSDKETETTFDNAVKMTADESSSTSDLHQSSECQCEPNEQIEYRNYQFCCTPECFENKISASQRSPSTSFVLKFTHRCPENVEGSDLQKVVVNVLGRNLNIATSRGCHDHPKRVSMKVKADGTLLDSKQGRSSEATFDLGDNLEVLVKPRVDKEVEGNMKLLASLGDEEYDSPLMQIYGDIVEDEITD